MATAQTDTQVIRDDNVPTKKQKEFYRAAGDVEAEEILFDGAIRSGKTQAACRLIAAWAWHYGGPNWRAVVIRRTYRELADSTQTAFMHGDGKMPPACPQELHSFYRAKDDELYLKNGARIMFRSVENARDAEDKLRNVTLAAAFVDQVEELSSGEYFQLYETLVSRCSDPRGPRKVLVVANPGPEDHWVYKRFVDARTREEQTRRVSVTLFDNEHNLPPSYIKKMQRREQSNPMWYRRFILGEWGAFGGKRFPVWDPEKHVVPPRPIPAGWEIVNAIDYGWANPTASIWCAIDYDGRWWVVGEHYEKEKPVSYHAKSIRQWEHEHSAAPSSRWLDPSAWAARSEYHSPALEFADWGVDCGRAQNDRLGGWNRLDEMLTNELSDGFPQLRVFSSCENLIREIPSAKIKDGTDDIEKENDHALDALRYAIMSRMPAPEEEAEEEEGDIRDRIAQHLIDKAMGREVEPVRLP